MKDEHAKAVAKFEAEVKRRRDEMTADELALAKRSKEVEEAAMDVAAQVAKAAESRASSEAALEQCRLEKERLAETRSELEKEAARVNAQRTVVERAFEDAAEERRVLAEAAEEADAVKSELEKSVAELDAKHADADARAAVLDEVTALHQQWEREQKARRVARETVEVAEAAERAATEQTARARVELAGPAERARRAFEASEAALDERERSWRTRGGRSAGTRTRSARRRTARPSARSVRRGRISSAKAEMSREFGGDEPRSVPRRSRLRPRPAATRGRDRRSQALLASFDAGVPAIAAPARSNYASDRAVAEMIGKVEELDVYSLEDDAAAAAAAHAMLPGDPSDVVTPSKPRDGPNDSRDDDNDGAVVRVALPVVPGGRMATRTTTPSRTRPLHG